MRILLVEDDVETATFLSRELSKRDHDVIVARDGRDALFMVGDDQFDAIILDRRLPLIDGLEVLKRLRNQDVSTPVVMLTALGALSDKVEGLDGGADDYVVKPVELDELDARLRALVRRPAVAGEAGVLRAGSIEINLLRHKVKRGDRAIELLPLEFSVLAALVRNADKVMTRKMLLEEVWGYDFEPKTNVVDAQIARIRTKLDFAPYGEAIMTIRGTGYMISDAA
jgi:DNA-binding response OmpR family regulator